MGNPNEEENVVEFPGQNPAVQEALEKEEPKVQLTEEQMKEVVAKGQKVAIEKMDRNRKEGLEKADRALLNLDEDNGLAAEPGVEARLRALEGAVRGLTTALEGVNGLTGVIKHDLINTITGIDTMSQDQWRKGAHLQTLLQLLKEKEVVTEEELKDVWDRVVPQMIEALRAKSE